MASMLVLVALPGRTVASMLVMVALLGRTVASSSELDRICVWARGVSLECEVSAEVARLVAVWDSPNPTL